MFTISDMPKSGETFYDVPAWREARTVGPLHCGHPFSESSHITDGSAILPDGRRECYQCSHARTLDVIEHAPSKSVFPGGYLSSDGRTITDWPGMELGRVVRRGARHHWSHDRFYVTVRDVFGGMWHGTASEGMYVSLRRSKDCA